MATILSSSISFEATNCSYDEFQLRRILAAMNFELRRRGPYEFGPYYFFVKKLTVFCEVQHTVGTRLSILLYSYVPKHGNKVIS